MAIKKVYLKKKIESTIYDIYPRTSADQVDYNATTVAAQLGTIAQSLSDITTATTGTIDTRIKAARDDLYNQIMGITDEDQTTVNEAYDTLKEVAAYIAEHGQVASGMLSDISNLKSTVGDASSGLVKKVADLEGTIGDSTSGLVKGLADANSAIDAIPVVEDSETNGNIVIDGTETTVYTHPATHDADMIVDTTSTHKFVTAAQLNTINKAAAVVYSATEPEASAMGANDLWMVEVAAD